MGFIEKKVKKPKKHGFFPLLSENGPKICQKKSKISNPLHFLKLWTFLKIKKIMAAQMNGFWFWRFLHLSFGDANIYFCKSALKMAKIRTLRAFGGQDSSPKIFKCGSGLSYELGQSPQQEIFRFDHFWTSRGPVKIRLFRL